MNSVFLFFCFFAFFHKILTSEPASLLEAAFTDVYKNSIFMTN